jgi:hypothetical protein
MYPSIGTRMERRERRKGERRKVAIPVTVRVTDHADQAGWHVHVYNWRSFATKNRICPAGISFLLGGADYKAPVQ